MPIALIIEDDLIIADFVEEVLMEGGYSCNIARTVKEAIALAKQQPPQIAIVDVFLADGSLGTQVAPFLIELNAGVLYTTATADAIAAAPGHAYLRKPFRLADLARAVEVVTCMVRGSAPPQGPPGLIILSASG